MSRGITHCSDGVYRCRLRVGGKTVYCGSFQTLDEAERNMSYQRQLHSRRLSKDHRYVLNLMATIPSSFVNGFGDRFVVWFQGCGFACRGCFNTESWSFGIRRLVYVDELLSEILSSGCEGVTISGGEPLMQPRGLLELLRVLEQYVLTGVLRYGIICYSGFREEELASVKESDRIINLVDVFIDGRYVEDLKTADSIAGSSNQRFRFSKESGRGESLISRISLEEIDKGVEIHSSAREKTVQITGFPNIDRRLLKSFGLSVKQE